MKKFTKLLGIVLIIALVMSMGISSAFADDVTGRYPTDTGKITLNNAEDGETYTLYQIFTLLSFADGNTAADQHTDDRYNYAIKSDSNWLGFVTGTGAGAAYFDIDQTNPVTVGSETYYNVFVKDSGPFGTSFNGNDENTRDEAIASAAPVQAFAQAAIAYAKTTANGVTPVDTKTASNQTVEFTNLPLGYYLIDSSLGTLATLDSTNKDITVIDKNEKPTITKQVKASNKVTEERDTTSYKYNGNGIWVENTDYNIGDTVTFFTTVTVPKGAKNYKLHDVMEKGLTFSGANTVKLYTSTPVNEGYVTIPVSAGETTYQVVTSNLTDGCDFEITFADAWLAGLTNNTIIEIEYDAVLNKDAIIKGETETADTNNTTISAIEGGNTTPDNTQQQIPIDNNEDGKNTNNTILSFGVGSSTVWDNATVETFEFDLVKVKDNNSTTSTVYELLKDAKFKFYTADQVGADGKLISTAAPTGFVADGTQVYRLPDNTEASATKVTEFTSDDTNPINFEGLKAGTYYLEETQAPSGYNKLSGLIKVVIGTDGSITITLPGGTSGSGLAAPKATSVVADKKYDTAAQNQGGIMVINKSGTELPSTGGIGTTIFYVVGSILVVAAGVLLITKKRMSREG